MATKPTTAEDIGAIKTIVDRTDVRSTMTGLVRLENILVAAEPKYRAVRMAVIDLPWPSGSTPTSSTVRTTSRPIPTPALPGGCGDRDARARPSTSGFSDIA